MALQPVRLRRHLLLCGSKSVLDEAPAFHDRGQVASLLLEHTEISQRIAINHQKIGEGARLDNAELPLHAHDFRIDGGGGGERLRGRQHLSLEQEFKRLVLVKRAQEVAAVAYAHSGISTDLYACQAGIKDRRHLSHAMIWKAEPLPELGTGMKDRQSRNHIGAVLGHEFSRLLVDQVAVLDRTHPAFNGSPNGAGGVGMSHRVCLPSLGLLHQGANLLDGEIDGLWRSLRSCDATRSIELDLVGALPPEPLHHLLYSNARNVRHVMTNGNLQVHAGKLTVADENRVVAEGGAVSRRIWELLEQEQWFDAPPPQNSRG